MLAANFGRGHEGHQHHFIDRGSHPHGGNFEEGFGAQGYDPYTGGNTQQNIQGSVFYSPQNAFGVATTGFQDPMNSNLFGSQYPHGHRPAQTNPMGSLPPFDYSLDPHFDSRFGHTHNDQLDARVGTASSTANSLQHESFGSPLITTGEMPAQLSDESDNEGD